VVAGRAEQQLVEELGPLVAQDGHQAAGLPAVGGLEAVEREAGIPRRGLDELDPGLGNGRA
jgi:hypothetical protein